MKGKICLKVIHDSSNVGARNTLAVKPNGSRSFVAEIVSHVQVVPDFVRHNLNIKSYIICFIMIVQYFYSQIESDLVSEWMT